MPRYVFSRRRARCRLGAASRSRRMAFVTFAPPPPLHPSIERIWDWHVEPGELRFERILPQPGSTLILNLLEDEMRVYDDDGGRRCERLAGSAYSGQFTRSFV